MIFDNRAAGGRVWELEWRVITSPEDGVRRYQAEAREQDPDIEFGPILVRGEQRSHFDSAIDSCCSICAKVDRG